MYLVKLIMEIAMNIRYKKITMSLALGTLLMGSSAFAAIGFTPPETLSSGGEVTGNGAAFKTKLVRMGNGLLVSAFGDSISGSNAVAYGLKADDVHPVRDIFVRTCMPSDANNHCASQEDWSAAVNISNTADKTSSSTKWTRDENGDLIDSKVPFPVILKNLIFSMQEQLQLLHGQISIVQVVNKEV